jgi:hypothetical protein
VRQVFHLFQLRELLMQDYGESIPVKGIIRRVVPRIITGLALLAPVFAGCTAFNPLKGVPVNYFPHELRGESRSGKRTIDLSLLRQTPPDAYLIDAGDVLGIYIEGVLGRKEEIPPVHFPLNGETPPSMGYPIPVREDGSISLPLTKPIPVRGLTIREVENAIRKAYTVDQEILQPGREGILVSLQRPRVFNVLVIRQESSSADLGGGSSGGRAINLGAIKRGTGKLVALPAYKNDVLHALAETGGLPGLDAENTIYVIRRRKHAGSQAAPQGGPASHEPLQSSYRRQSAIRLVQGEQQGYGPGDPTGTPWGHAAPPALPPGPGHTLPQMAPGSPALIPPHGTAETGPLSPIPDHSFPQHFQNPGFPAHGGHAFPPQDFAGSPELMQFYGRDSQIIRIPVRLHPGETPRFTEKDIILQDGDIVFIESRDTEIFYTGGLLGGGQYPLPRDYDLDVLGAVSIATAGQASGGGSGGFGNRIGGVSSLNQDISVSASDVVVLRQLPNGSQVPIKVDLNKALRDPKHRIRIQPGDYVVLQYKPHEAVAAFVERNLLAGGLIGLAASNFTGGGGGGGGR